MISQGYHRILWILVAIALAAGSLSAPGKANAPIETAPLVAAIVHHGDSAEEAEGSGHIHDDGASDEHRPGHLHGDGQLDHSHEKPAVLASAVRVVALPGANWLLTAFATLNLQTPRRLDRPPRRNAVR